MSGRIRPTRFAEKEWLHQSARNFSQLRMNACVCTHPFTQVICLNAVGEKKSQMLFEQTSHEVGSPCVPSTHTSKTALKDVMLMKLNPYFANKPLPIEV